jgi:hypothetical protein
MRLRFQQIWKRKINITTWITVELNKWNKFQQITYSNFKFNLQHKVTDYCQSARQVTITTCRKPEVVAARSDVEDGLLALDAAQLVVRYQWWGNYLPHPTRLWSPSSEQHSTKRCLYVCYPTCSTRGYTLRSPLCLLHFNFYFNIVTK